MARAGLSSRDSLCLNRAKLKEFVLEILRETDFISESGNWDAIANEPSASQLKQSLAAINKACSAFLNGQETQPRVDKFSNRSTQL